MLSLLGVDDDWIARDYAMTTEALLPHKQRFSFLWKDDPELEPELIRAHLHTDPQTMLGFLQAVRAQFGTVAGALQLPHEVLPLLRARYVVS